MNLLINLLKSSLRALIAIMLAACVPAPAWAHLTSTSSIELDFLDDRVAATITVPEAELGYAYGARTLDPAMMRVRIGAVAPDGRAWRIDAIKVQRVVHQGVPDAVAQIALKPPAGASARALRLDYNLVIDRVSSHVVLVTARSDFAGGVLQDHPKLLGSLRNGRGTLAIDVGKPSRWAGFAASFRLGMAHIAEGLDHLLFLLSLLLPAPLLAAGGRWQGPVGRTATIRRLIWIISAFTIGHSLTLIGGAVFGWSLPSQPVEIGIALSILISAIHAARPLFPGREALVAGGFGLIHGLAFATVIGNFSLQPFDKGLAILGFNLGIETIQLVVVAIVLPLLLWLANRPAYQHFRQIGALLTGTAALYWLWERI